MNYRKYNSRYFRIVMINITTFVFLLVTISIHGSALGLFEEILRSKISQTGYNW